MCVHCVNIVCTLYLHCIYIVCTLYLQCLYIASTLSLFLHRRTTFSIWPLPVTHFWALKTSKTSFVEKVDTTSTRDDCFYFLLHSLKTFCDFIPIVAVKGQSVLINCQLVSFKSLLFSALKRNLTIVIGWQKNRRCKWIFILSPCGLHNESKKRVRQRLLSRNAITLWQGNVQSESSNVFLFHFFPQGNFHFKYLPKHYW